MTGDGFPCSARELAAQLGLRRVGREWRGRCPACGYGSGLTLSEGEGGRVLWWCASCRDQAAVAAAISGDPAAFSSATPAAPREAETGDKRAAAVRMWGTAQPAEGSIVARYLAGRGGLILPPSAPVRLLPGARHPGGKRWPAMLALVVDHAGRPAAVHRTFLSHDGAGKAPVEPQRMTFGPVAGGAVRLHEPVPGAPLVVAEGIETALAAAVLLRAPAWASVSAGNMADAMRLPEAVRDVILAADNDPPGIAAVKRAAARLRGEGRRVRVSMPDRQGFDFNDVLRKRHSHG